MSEKPDPCPFCGGMDIRACTGSRYAWGKCVGCRAEGPMIEGTEPEAIAAWNARSPSPRVAELEAEVARLERFLSRAFDVLDQMAGEGMTFEGHEDPFDILMDYTAGVDPEADYRDVLKALASRTASEAPHG